MKRVMLKISGEALSGEGKPGFNAERMKELTDELQGLKNAGFEVVIVLGAGNFVRGRELTEIDIHRSVADYIGMLGTMMNALAFTEVLKNAKIPTQALSMIDVPRIIQSYRRDSALEILEKGDFLICAGGTGRPFFTTDTNSVQLAIELECDVYLKATKVDGLYSDDPKTNHDAKFIREATFEKVLQNGYKVMDTAAFALCAEYSLPIRIFNMNKPGNLLKAAKNLDIGSLVS